MKVQAIVPAAGAGSRMKKGLRKPFLILGNKPILIHTLTRLQASPFIQSIILVVDSRDIDISRKLIRKNKLDKIANIVKGGKNRFESVWNGLASTDSDTDLVLIHDGVRPFLSYSIIFKTIKKASKFGGAVAAVPATSTIKFVKKSGLIDYTPNRSRLWTIATPQVFCRKILEEAYEKGRAAKTDFFDDSSLVEKLGEKVRVIMDSCKNIKITTPLDLLIGEAILKNGGVK